MKPEILPEDHRILRSDLLALLRKVKLVVFDFDGVFTDNSVYVDEEGREFVRCSRLEGFGLRRLAKVGIKSFVLSTETNPVVGMRCKKLDIPYKQSCERKLDDLNLLLADLNIESDEIVFVGNDVNDKECLEKAGLSIIVEDAHKDVRSSAQLITKNRGGYGAVREICDFIYDVHKQ